MISYYYNYYKRFLKSYQTLKNAKPKHTTYPSIGLIDPSIGSNNLGDIIIQNAVTRHLRTVYPDAFLTSYPSQLHRTYDARLKMAQEDVVFVGGTNLLASNMEDRYQWKIDPLDKVYLKNKIVLMGTGWWQYQQDPNDYTKSLFQNILSQNYIHSVRDSYTEQMLKKAGIENVVNTTCPTLWQLSPEHCVTIPQQKAKNVITTLTFYHRNAELDRRMMEILQANYENVYLWVQGLQDFDYLKEIYPGWQQVKLVPPVLELYNEMLESEDIEYFGTRLHAGVRALQKGKRTLIVAVDNRAIEIGKDTNLNVIDRKQVDSSLDFVSKPYKTDIKLPNDTIALWKNQFIRK
ncbi:polysaccharide pyruvyl transferase family protein [Pedobacter sp. HMF7647]|uniref:Polysaccharide pyruvyl transferase family protein n=1 Tax=Hufsiella arboris TaxID=2695275 RepID=A0A7K1YC10_9SPHI|nr:polysaccharide pyruvyl transferase family protein [Hufsiella arboris]MXV52127.1 polysaccharide pyruvyl transferase family protein [Hufsiella arboris]